jgi:alkylhydroperoxidase family enzyme
VIAKTMGCVDCLEGSRRGLHASGIGDGDIDQVLATLDAPVLDDTERRLLPWARETVRYRASDIQTRTAELASELSEQQLLEAVGTAALANATVRLAMLLR